MLLVAAAVTAGLVVPATSAGATQNYRTIGSSSWAYTDSQDVHDSFADQAGDALVGSWRDEAGKHHIAKSYFTFDLRPWHGARIMEAEMWAEETAANDCSVPRSTELWLAAPASRPTWADQPAELVRLHGAGAFDPCLWPRVEWDASEMVARAVAAGQDSITFVMRMADAVQGDLAYGRRYANQLHITLTYNFPPDTPTDLSVGPRYYAQKRCAEHDQPIMLGSSQLEVSAALSDPDGWYGLGGSAAFWPVDHPEQRVQVDRDNAYDRLEVAFPPGMVQNGGTYAFAVRADDGHDVSPWSQPCLITADLTAPSVAPTVSSTVYPEDDEGGGPNVPGEFVFDANGVDDVVGFYWGEFGPYDYVAADGPGGRASVTFTPTRSGPTDVVVSSVDRAGNRSPSVRYHFWVASNYPGVTSPTGEQAELGVPKEFRMTPGMAGVTEYVYRIDDGPESPVAAGPDGTASVSVVPTTAYEHSFVVFSRTADGVESESAELYYSVPPDEPVVTFATEEWQLGAPIQATFSTDRDDVRSYVYRFNDGDPVTVPAGPDGTATVTVTATEWGYNYLEVSSITRDGYEPGRVTEGRYVDSAAPEVTSPQYPEYGTGGSPGVPGEFTFTTPLAGVAEYVYRFGSGAETVVPAGPDGSATVTFTPDRTGWFYLRVSARNAAGVASGESYYSFQVAADQ